VSRPTHREARFDHVLNFLLIQNNIHLNGKVRFEDLLKLYYDEIYSHRKVYPEMIETLVALQKAGKSKPLLLQMIVHPPQRRPVLFINQIDQRIGPVKQHRFVWKIHVIKIMF
ncbi:MAG: hypothetical protein V3T45_07890, partial [Nitrospinaceae bacterium]